MNWVVLPIQAHLAEFRGVYDERVLCFELTKSSGIALLVLYNESLQHTGWGVHVL